MTFTELSHYATFLVPTKKERVQRVVEGLSYRLRFGMARDVETKTTFHQDVEISRRLECIHRPEREAKKPHGTRGFSGAYSWVKDHHRGYSSRLVQSALQVSRSPLASHGFQSTRPRHSSFSAPPACGSYSGYFSRPKQA
ncbi:uncharacterized protein [Nicotiana tomentosiformis]|uniref:uncharacterized protein n=1 Tax=Nicotiana tomentosiformis TaxID=4098 RepID=UPI00388C66DD